MTESPQDLIAQLDARIAASPDALLRECRALLAASLPEVAPTPGNASNALIEAGALRQLRHNDGSPGFVMAYDRAITDRVLAGLTVERQRILGLINSIQRWDTNREPQTFLDKVSDGRYVRLDDLIALIGGVDSASRPNGWEEAAIAWKVCASIHRDYAKGKDALFSTRQADFAKHADAAQAMLEAAPIAADLPAPNDAVDLAGEREAFEAWITSVGRGHMLEMKVHADWYKDTTIEGFWTVWRTRAALASRPQVSASGGSGICPNNFGFPHDLSLTDDGSCVHCGYDEDATEGKS